ncbi:MAG: response regulator, partial [Gemmatimonadaceae bacterium]
MTSVDDRHVAQAGGVRVLAVEDSATQAAALASLLEREGYDIILAGSGEEALATIQSQPIDIVLSDVVMPGMDGYELCRRIKEGTPTVPVILLTSLNDPLAIVRGLESGADHYVTKPYDPEQLIARVRQVLHRVATTTP